MTRPRIQAGNPLTVRESEIAALIVEGLSNKEIANRLNISDHTVKFHVLNVATKLGCTSRVVVAVKHARWLDAQ
jgi:DNA-binding CsgD family transcriptional regulator